MTSGTSEQYLKKIKIIAIATNTMHSNSRLNIGSVISKIVFSLFIKVKAGGVIQV